MQKLIKNWIFTMIVCMLLTTLAVLMFLSGFKVGDLYIGESILHIVAASALMIYVIFALIPLALRYRGVVQGFVIGEILILLLTAVAHIIMNFGVRIPILYRLDVCSVVGLAFWLRGVVETVHAYTSNAYPDESARIPLWRLLCYILLSAVGVWQLVKPLLKDEVFIFIIGGAAAIIAVIFGYTTAINLKAASAARKAKKAEAQEEQPAQAQEPEKEPLPTQETPVPALPAPTQDSEKKQDAVPEQAQAAKTEDAPKVEEKSQKEEPAKKEEAPKAEEEPKKETSKKKGAAKK